MIPITSPAITSTRIAIPNMLNTLTDKLWRNISPRVRISERMMRGRRFKRSGKIPMPDIGPEIKQPIGMVQIPHNRPRSTFFLCALSTAPITKGRVKDTVAPIIEATTSPLKAPRFSESAISADIFAPPISFARSRPINEEGSIPVNPAIAARGA